MGFDQIDTPVRLTWDFPAECSLVPARMLEVAARISDAGVFFVTLEGNPLLHPALREILASLHEGGCRLLVACSGTPQEMTALSGVAAWIERIHLDIAGFLDGAGALDSGGLSAVIDAIRRAGCEPLLSLVPLRRNLRYIPEILRFCTVHDITRFKLPNASIGGSFRGYSAEDLPRWEDLEKFRQLWSKALDEIGRIPAVEIHDRFLWEIIAPGEDQARSEYNGCQAANTLGHVDAEGIVHPCAAWLEPLGSLLDKSLYDIWQSPQRHHVRVEISHAPKGCHGCVDWSACLGGCRGLSRMLNQENGCRDLMCRERRS